MLLSGSRGPVVSAGLMARMHPLAGGNQGVWNGSRSSTGSAVEIRSHRVSSMDFWTSAPPRKRWRTASRTVPSRWRRQAIPRWRHWTRSNGWDVASRHVSSD